MSGIRLSPGVALVLAGPQGCGKTMKARTIAAAHGAYAEADARLFGDDFRIGSLIFNRPATVIVDEVPAEALRSIAVKALVGSKTLTISRRGHVPAEAPTPNFIFCTCDVDAVRAMPADRRFHVVYL